MTQRETKEYDLIDKALSILQEFYIEFFGIFLPGLKMDSTMSVREKWS